MIHTARAATLRALLLSSAALIGAAAPAAARAQSAEAAAPDQAATLGEVVVTAQKRSQNLQDVPISVSAVGQDALQANRVSAVMDLNTVAPNLAVHLTAAGSAIPSFTIRGMVSYGVVPGSDKEVSIYIDGVYLGATRGSSFDLPDLERIEVLRGPQGTLFGRNATAGAISIVTRDPPGRFGVRQELTGGNYDQFRSRTRIDFPAWGPLSATVSYLHDERRGDIKNLGAGTVWDRTGPNTGEGVQVSPKWLGSKNSDVWFAAVKFQPNDRINVTYKFDHTSTHYTPDGVAAVAVDPAALGPAGGGLLSYILATQPTPPLIWNSGERPKAVNNSYSTPAYTLAYGHNVTAQVQINDNLSLKNILAYRYTYNYSNYQLDGLGGLVNTVPALGPVGSPFVLLGTQYQTLAKQWSNETQLNYTSKLLTLTTGLLYYHDNARSGGPPGMPSTWVLTVFPNGVVPVGDPQLPYNYSTSQAAYAQAEVHVTPKLDLVGGYRITRDIKSGTFYSSAPPLSFKYSKTKPAYMAGVNYKPDDLTLLYAKYSTGFVSGGAVGPVAFEPETAKSWEVGAKADLLDRRLRTNLALFDVRYRHIQSPQSGLNVGHPELGTVIIDQGDAKAKGFELEVTALPPVAGLTLGGGLGYTDFKYTSMNPILGTLDTVLPTLRPKWTAQIRGEYVTEPLFGEARLALRTDANWRSSERIDQDPFRTPESFRVLQESPASWILNARLSLERIRAPGGTELELAIWGRNLNDNKAINFADIIGGFAASTNYEQARTFGVDLILTY